MRTYEEKILNTLLDKYENSKTFSGSSLINQNFQKKINILFPGYEDSSKYELFSKVNEQISSLEHLGVINVKRLKRGKLESDIVDSVSLVIDKLPEIYNLLGRRSKEDLNNEIKTILNKYQNNSVILQKFCYEQLNRLNENKAVKHFTDLVSFENILKILSEIENVETETFVRNFSIKILGDSKAFEKIKNTVISILYDYGDFANKDTILDELNIIKNPGYVYVKGKGIISISGQILDLSKLDDAIGLSSATLDNIENIKITGSKVVTIENLTTFHTYKNDEAFIIYLGGYHNSIRRKMIEKLYENNPAVKYYHYGDIDAGGFYILLDLRKKTGISFIPLNMDIDTLKKYEKYTKPLSSNDRIRLENLSSGEFSELVKYMLDHNCKLEQEGVEEGI